MTSNDTLRCKGSEDGSKNVPIEEIGGASRPADAGVGRLSQTADLANEVSWDPASENRLAQLFGVPIPEKNPDISPLPISSDGLLAASAA